MARVPHGQKLSLIFLSLVFTSTFALDINKFRHRVFHRNKRAGEAAIFKRFFYPEYFAENHGGVHEFPAYYGPYGQGGISAYQSGHHGYQSDHPRLDCPPYKPFKCPDKEEVVCISIQYLCDGAPDCPEDGYDENPQLCTAAKRPPVDETQSFLYSLLASHGPNYLEKLFGQKARNQMQALGGVDNVAVALSESQTIDDFARSMHLESEDTDHLRHVFMAVENGDLGSLKAMGIKDSELGDVKFFLERLINTGFLD